MSLGAAILFHGRPSDDLIHGKVVWVHKDGLTAICKIVHLRCDTLVAESTHSLIYLQLRIHLREMLEERLEQLDQVFRVLCVTIWKLAACALHGFASTCLCATRFSDAVHR